MTIYISRLRTIIISTGLLIAVCLVSSASAYWVWTPDTKKFINPKYAVKDSPKEQYDYAMGFYDAKDYQRAVTEFEKLAKHYEYSEYAGKAQYHVGLSYENMGKYYLAFQAYQKAIDNFPHLDNVEEIIAREFNIAGLYAEKESPKVLGTDIMTPTDRVVEIYRKVVDNAPFGKLADEALFRMGEALKRVERYDEAVVAYQKILDEYPSSPFTEKARYEVAYCAYKASLKPAYDQESTDKAIKAFSEFTQENKDNALSKEADQTIRRLKDKAAEKSILTAQFYEKIHKKESAIIYYQDVIDRYADSSYAAIAQCKIEELRTGKKKRAAASAEVPAKGGLFSIWPGKAPAVVAPQPAAAGAAGALPPAPAKAKKTWNWFNLGKPAAPPPPQPAGPVVKKDWLSSFGFGKKTPPPLPAGETATEPLVPVSAEPLPLVEAAIASVPPVEAPAPAAPQVVTVPHPASSVSVPVPLPSVPQPIVVASQPAVAQCPPATPKKKRGWGPLNMLGLGADETPEPAKTVTVARLPSPDAPPVAVEPRHGGESAVPSTDDINVEKDPDGI